jgi:hypothetical protein
LVTFVVDCQFGYAFLEVERPVDFSVDSVVVDAADGDKVQLVLVAD